MVFLFAILSIRFLHRMKFLTVLMLLTGSLVRFKLQRPMPFSNQLNCISVF